MSDLIGTIRRLDVADAAPYRRIRLQTLELAPDRFGALLADEARRDLGSFADTLATSTVFGAFDAGQIVGTARLQAGTGAKERHKGSLRGIFVHPSCRGRGLGRALVEHAIAAARPALEQLTLTVVADNDAAIALYESLGFRRFGLEPRARKWNGAYIDVASMFLLLRP